MDVEEYKFFGLCKCCLQDGCFRSLWVEYDEDGVVQNYGEMLNECFSLQWQKPENTHLEQICEDCVKRTANAYSFRQQVLMSHNQLNSHEVTEDPSIVLDSASGERKFRIIVNQEPVTDVMEHDIGEFEEVEYLEEENEKELVEVEIVKEELKVEEEQLVDDPEFYPEVPVKRKWPRKKKKSERLRTYKNYTFDDLKHCLGAVKDGSMTVAEASAHYNVPRKTIAARILSDKRGEPTGQKAHKQEEMIKEIRTLLTYTNATPFKTRTAHYHCAYCSTDGPLFEDPDELRVHTKTQHAGERTKGVERILRPLWLNEVLKVDIENLHCTVCCIGLVSWNDMFKHLKEQHNLDFDEAYTRVIPFILTSELRCALCKENFPNYHHLDAHMNAHYNNYMCSECGDTFLAASRLKKHLNIHETGRFICEHCGKVFSLEKYKKKHIILVHKQEQKVRCLYCPEKFLGMFPRHQHMLECHSEKVKRITCEICGKTFDWRPYYLSHVRKEHENERNYKCSYCMAQFFLKSELRRHETTHTKVKGKFKCSVCGKVYSSKTALSNHSSMHEVVLEFKEYESTVVES